MLQLGRCEGLLLHYCGCDDNVTDRERGPSGGERVAEGGRLRWGDGVAEGELGSDADIREEDSGREAKRVSSAVFIRGVREGR